MPHCYVTSFICFNAYLQLVVTVTWNKLSRGIINIKHISATYSQLFRSIESWIRYFHGIVTINNLVYLVL